MTDKIISIIITNYNYSQYIRECIESVFNNIYSGFNIEVIVVDDCSSDNSIDVLFDIKKYYDIKIHQNEKNLKISQTRNIGISLSSGEYIVCLDADDTIPYNYLQENYNNIIQNKINISYCNSKCFGYTNQTFNWYEFDPLLLRRLPFINCSAMFNRKIFDSNKFDINMNIGWEDYDFWLSALKSNYTFKKCNNTHLNYRIKNSGVNNNAMKNMETIKKYLRDKHGSFYLG